MKGIDVSTKDGYITSLLCFNSKASISILKELLNNTDCWGDVFPSLIESVENIRSENDVTSLKVILLGMMNIKWSIYTQFIKSVSDDHIVIEGNNLEQGDWANTRYLIHIKPSEKKNRNSHVSVTCQTSASSIPIPASALKLTLCLVKPMVKDCLLKLSANYMSKQHTVCR